MLPFPSAPSDDKTLKIAVYLNDLSGGGVERLTLTLVHALHRARAEVTLLLHSADGALALELPEGVAVRIFDTRRVLYDVGCIAHFLRQSKPDILLSSLNHNNVVACVAGFLAGGKTKVVVCQHIALSPEARAQQGWKYRIMPLIYRLIAPLAEGIVAVSQGVADDMAAATGIAARRIEVIYNPIFDEKLLARLSAGVRHQWLDQQQPIFVSAGRLVEQKNYSMLLRAFALYRKEHLGRLMIFGDGPQHQTLRQLAQTLEIETDVAFFGFVDNPLPFFNHAKAFILTSRFEGFANVLVEAMACGLPVISTDCPHGPAEILDGGKFGRLVQVDDVAGLAKMMAEDLATRFPGAVLRSRAAQFSTDASVARYLAFFKALIRGAK